MTSAPFPNPELDRELRDIKASAPPADVCPNAGRASAIVNTAVSIVLMQSPC